MPIHMGIMCDACRKVHFVATSPGIRPSASNQGMYLLTCRPLCRETREFRKDTMQPYRVSETVFNTGFEEEGEYELVPAGSKEPDQPKGRSEQSLTRGVTKQRMKGNHRTTDSE